MSQCQTGHQSGHALDSCLFLRIPGLWAMNIRKKSEGITRMLMVRISQSHSCILMSWPTTSYASYHGCGDDHNNKRLDGGSKQGLSLESTRSTSCWPIQVFSFILAIMEVIVYLAWAYFKGEKLKLKAFSKELAKALIYNIYVEAAAAAQVRRGRKRQVVDHTLMKAPLYAR
jgi:hypothetical protein